MSFKPKEVILKAEIDYGYEYTNKGQHIRIGRHVNDHPYHDFETKIKEAILETLPNEMRNIYSLDVKTRVIDIQSGSVVVFIGVALSAMGFIANYAGFFDGIQLIRRHLDQLLTRLLSVQYNHDFKVNVSIEFPNLTDPRDSNPFRYFRKHLGPESDHALAFLAQSETRYNNRDAFFWFLLVLNIVLMTIIGMLVWGAVSKVYFA